MVEERRLKRVHASNELFDVGLRCDYHSCVLRDVLQVDRNVLCAIDVNRVRRILVLLRLAVSEGVLRLLSLLNCAVTSLGLIPFRGAMPLLSTLLLGQVDN